MKLYIVKIVDRKRQKNYIYQILDEKQVDLLLSTKKIVVETVGVLNV